MSTDSNVIKEQQAISDDDRTFVGYPSVVGFYIHFDRHVFVSAATVDDSYDFISIGSFSMSPNDTLDTDDNDDDKSYWSDCSSITMESFPPLPPTTKLDYPLHDHFTRTDSERLHNAPRIPKRKVSSPQFEVIDFSPQNVQLDDRQSTGSSDQSLAAVKQLFREPTAVPQEKPSDCNNLMANVSIVHHYFCNQTKRSTTREVSISE